MEKATPPLAAEIDRLRASNDRLANVLKRIIEYCEVDAVLTDRGGKAALAEARAAIANAKGEQK